MSKVITTKWGDISLNDTTWTESWSFIARTCVFTGDHIPAFSTCMLGRRVRLCPGGLHTEKYWTTPKELMMHKLKGNV